MQAGEGFAPLYGGSDGQWPWAVMGSDESLTLTLPLTLTLTLTLTLNLTPNPNPKQVLDGHWGPDGHAIALTDLGGRLSLYSLGLGAAAPPVQVGLED